MVISFLKTYKITVIFSVINVLFEALIWWGFLWDLQLYTFTNDHW